MEYSVEYYLSSDGELFASLKEDKNYPLYFNKNEWKFYNKSFDEILKTKKLTQISPSEMIIITFGKFVDEIYESKGIKILNEENKITDTVKYFFDRFILFAKEDYFKKFHNKNQDLTYSLKELDIHYENCGYTSFVDEYFNEILLRQQKGEFKDFTIKKLKNDYLVKFNKNILD